MEESKPKGEDIDIIPDEEAEAGAPAVKKLREKLAACLKEKQEYLSGWQRAKADLVNARKEDAKRLAEREGDIRENAYAEFIPVIDSFDRALAAGEAKDGAAHIRGQLLAVLRRAGIEPFSPHGERFDPAFHESVGAEATDEDGKEGLVARVLEPGYRRGSRVIRPAKVVIFHKQSE